MSGIQVQDTSNYSSGKYALAEPSLKRQIINASVLFGLFVILPVVIIILINNQWELLSTSKGLYLLSALLGVFTAVLSFNIANPFGVRINYSAKKRTCMVANIIHRTQQRLIISTGCLDSEVYSSDLVGDAFKDLDPNVKITIFHRSENLSRNSRNLIEYLKSRGTEFVYWKNLGDAKIPNDFIISDMQHIRIELFDNKEETNKGNKFAVYFYDNITMPKFYFRKYLSNLDCASELV